MWQGATAVSPPRQEEFEGLLGIADHGPREGAWEGALAFANLGFPGQAFRGSRWPKHKAWLRKFVVDIVSEVQQQQLSNAAASQPAHTAPVAPEAVR